MNINAQQDMVFSQKSIVNGEAVIHCTQDILKPLQYKGIHLRFFLKSVFKTFTSEIIR